MPQYSPVNMGGRTSTAITTNTTTAINIGSGATLYGYIVNNAGTSWTAQFYNGDPASGGTAIGPALTLASGIFPLPLIRAPQGLYVVTAGTTAGSLQVLFY